MEGVKAELFQVCSRGCFAVLTAPIYSKMPCSEGVHVCDGAQVAETLPAEILEKMHAPPKDADVPVITPDRLPEFDGFIFGFPTRCDCRASVELFACCLVAGLCCAMGAGVSLQGCPRALVRFGRNGTAGALWLAGEWHAGSPHARFCTLPGWPGLVPCPPR